MARLARKGRQPAPSATFQEAYGEPLSAVLDLETWRTGEDMLATYERISTEVEAAVRQEARMRDPIRADILPRIPLATGAPRGAGVYRATVEELKRVHRGLLFTGAVEACDATRYTHDTLPLTVTQIGVSLVAYNGQQGTWVQRLFRRDLRESVADPAAEALDLLERRAARGGLNQPSNDELSELAVRAIMAYAERGVLLRRPTAPWRMGHGNPTPYELLLRPGTVSVLDLSDSGSPVLNNLVIADLLRGIQEAQEDACKTFETATRQGRDAPRPTRALVVIEEAHEFLSARVRCWRSVR